MPQFLAIFATCPRTLKNPDPLSCIDLSFSKQDKTKNVKKFNGSMGEGEDIETCSENADLGTADERRLTRQRSQKYDENDDVDSGEDEDAIDEVILYSESQEEASDETPSDQVEEDESGDDNSGSGSEEEDESDEEDVDVAIVSNLNENEQALHQAVKAGDYKLVEQILTSSDAMKDVNIDAKDAENSTCLHEACLHMCQFSKVNGYPYILF